MEEKVTKKSETTVTDVPKAKATTRRKAKVRTVNDVNLSDRVSIDNLCDWSIGFKSIESTRDLSIDPHVKDYKMLTVAEVDSQVKIGNVAFIGTDGYGSHAAIRINDPVIREYVFGEDISPIQLTVDAVHDLFESKNKKEFTERLSKLVVTQSEKRMIAVMCSNDNFGLDIDNVPNYMLSEIERVSGISIN